jgi:dynamin GTPase
MQVIERLTERRIAVEKAVTTLGEAPSGLRDVFELCRGFERAFTNLVNVSVHNAEG